VASEVDQTTPPADIAVDVSLIRWMLSLSVEGRLAVLQGFVDSVIELRRTLEELEAARRSGEPGDQ
jgi:hypothetical protein